jgi:hypothetical protein
VSEQRRATVLGISSVAPSPFLAGVLFAFLGCCLVGRLLSERNPYKWFTRFHHYIDPHTNFYPTASQVRALARERLDPHKVAVIVGGNSILQGHGQRAQHVWTRELQSLLGDQYCVLNLAVAGARPYDFGGVIAEALSGEYPRLILVTALGTSVYHAVDDKHTYRYLYWDAYYKGMLSPAPDRAARLAEQDAQKEAEGDTGPAELKAGRRLDSLLFFQDLWTTYTLRKLDTAWCAVGHNFFPAPRLLYPDPGGPPTSGGPPVSPEQWSKEAVWYWASAGTSLALGVPPKAGQDRSVSPDASPLARGLKTWFPAPTRGRSLILVPCNNPRFVNELPPELKAEYRWISVKTAEVLEAAGFAAVEVGSDFSEEDFVDFVHLSERGGRELAARVAPKVRAMAHRLGYLGEQEKR